ncbi:MAG: acyltransferase [Oscillospiraceae bacterium]|jgi:peptidoglycan/LPS O-acetylase OafA/YrhL|nr:acyltransferase [Oscillospiraceae bacterium]
MWANLTIPLSVNSTLWLRCLSGYNVPTYILISGIGLELGGKALNLRTFWKSRLLTIILPYIFWCLVTYIYLYFNWDIKQFLSYQAAHPTDFVYSLVRPIFDSSYQLDWHFYFVPLILLLYLVYPLLRKAVKRFTSQTLIILFAFSVVIGYIGYMQIFGITTIVTGFNLGVFSSMFMFSLGLSLNRERLTLIFTVARKIRVPLCVLAAVMVLLQMYLGYSIGLGSIGDPISSALYVLVMCLIICGFATPKEGKQQSAAARRFYSFVAKHSFTTYLIHLLVLRLLWQHTPLGAYSPFTRNPEASQAGQWVAYFATIIISVTVAALIDNGRKLLSKLLRKAFLRGSAKVR